MFGNLNQKLIFFMVLFAIIPLKNSGAASNSQLTGVWHIATTRAGSVLRPATLTFHADGTMNYKSGSVINRTDSEVGAHFFGRGGGEGVYAKVPGTVNEFVAQTEELLYDVNGNVDGRFLVTFDLVLNRGKSSADDTIDLTFTFQITKFNFGVPGLYPIETISGETVVASDGGIPGNIFAYRMTENCYLKGTTTDCFLGPIDIQKQ